MSVSIDSIYIYHITNVDNLPSIIAAGGLWSDAERERQGITNINIAHTHIKGRRKTTEVKSGNGGVVADYVPFYFCPRSPMLYSIHKGGVAGYAQGQAAVVHLCAKLSVAIERTAWCASTGHTDIAGLCTFFDYPDGFASLLDWEAIQSNAWGFPYFTQDSDMTRRKQAEFLAYKFFPWDMLAGIGVMDAATQSRAEQFILQANYKPDVRIIRKWYF